MSRWLHTLSTKAKTAVMVLSILTAQAVAAVAPFVPTAHVAADPKGNNGTLQVHEKTDPDFKKNTQPHVCDFNFEAFDLDASQTGNVTIVAQSPTSDNGNPLVLSLTTDENGDGATAYVNDGATYTLANGHYKATLDNKFGTDSNDKAKSKVFWVDCGETVPVEPADPTLTTQVSNTELTLDGESSVRDTATVVGTEANGDVTGTIDFYLCGPAASEPDCLTGGTLLSTDTIGDGMAYSSYFTPSEAGHYCFRTEYNPDEDADYNAVTHTDKATECFNVIEPEVEPTYGTITVKKVLYPATDLGVFNLNIDDSTEAANVGDGGTTGAVTVETGDHTVSETAGTATDMSNYDSTYSCTNDMSGTGTTIPAFTVETDENVVCTFTNQRHVIPQVLGDSTTVTPVKVTPAVLGATLTNTGLPVVAYVTAAVSLLGSAVFVISRRSPNLG